MKPRVVCVYERGNGFEDDCVRCLMRMVERHAREDYDFLCMTNRKLDFCETVPLRSKCPGWWKKIELFRKDMVYPGKTVYLDLDTVIFNDITPLFSSHGRFGMLGRFFLRRNRPAKNWLYASGIMVWEGDFSFVHGNFRERHMYSYSGDQKYIETSLRTCNLPDFKVQDVVSVASYKGKLKGVGPEDPSILCFHGAPRPWEVDDPKIRRHML